MSAAILILVMQTLIARSQIAPPGDGWYAAPAGVQSVPAQQCVQFPIPAPGVAPGMVVAPGWPPLLPDGLHGIMYAGDQSVVVRVCNITSSPRSIDGLTFTARVLP